MQRTEKPSKTKRAAGLSWLCFCAGSAALGPIFPAVLPAERARAPWYADKSNLLTYIDANGSHVPVKALGQWQRRRAHILANMQRVMGPLPGPSRKVPLQMRTHEVRKLPGVTQKKVTFAAERGDRVWAYLLVPDGLKGRAPAMLCLHPTSRLGKAATVGGAGANRAYALELARRGYVTLAPDYLNSGDYRFDPYRHGYASATMKGIWNHMRAVDLLQSLPEVDGDRIGCIGHSLGGHNTLFLAVFDARIKVMVSSCGFNSFFKYYGGDLAGWSHKGYMPRIASVYRKDPRRMPFDFPEVVAALAPRPLFINAPKGDRNFEVSGVRDCVRAARPVYALHGAADKLVAVHPDAGHDFPPKVRQAAYQFVDKALAPRGKAGPPATAPSGDVRAAGPRRGKCPPGGSG